MARRLPPRDKFGRFIKSDGTSSAAPQRPKRDTKGRFRRATDAPEPPEPKEPKRRKRKSRAKPFEKSPRPRRDFTPRSRHRPADIATVRGRRELLKAALDQASELLAAPDSEVSELPILDSDVHVHVNRDGSIDAELHVMGGRGIEPIDVFERLGKVMPEVLPEFWVSTGVRFEPSTDDAERYYKYKGQSQVQSNYQEYTKENLPNNIVTGQLITEKVQEMAEATINSYFIRLFWSPEGDQPGRADYREDKSTWGKDRSTYNKLVASTKRKRAWDFD